MSKPFFCVGVAIVSTFMMPNSAIATPLPSPLQSGSLRSDVSAPLCYIQFQGNSAIDVSQVCGKKPGETPANNAAVTASSAAPPVFDPKTVNASTTEQCNFIDANGKPCPPK